MSKEDMELRRQRRKMENKETFRTELSPPSAIMDKLFRQRADMAEAAKSCMTLQFVPEEWEAYAALINPLLKSTRQPQ